MDRCSDSPFSLTSLLCQESTDCFDEEVKEERGEQQESFLNLDYSKNDDKHIEMMIEKESSNFGTKNSEFSEMGVLKSDNQLKSSRLDAIKWILKESAYFGFGFQTAYLSIIYFDRFTSKRLIDSGESWAIQLLSIACLSLAAKMEELKVPALSKFQSEDFNFESKVIQKMELMVLSTLEWKMGSITPFSYLHYFIINFSNGNFSKDLVSKSIELVFAISKEVILMDHPPSLIAAASVLAAMDQRLTRKTVELKMSSISSCGSINNDYIFACYNVMKKFDKETKKTAKFVHYPDTTSIYSSSIDILEDSSFTSDFRTKKRKLSFSDCDKRMRYPMRSHSIEEKI